MCLRCGYVCDAHTSFHNPNAVPKPGDLSICMNCGAEYVRHADRWQPMTAAVRATLTPEERAAIEELHVARHRADLPDLAKGRGGRA
jgi:hypothetical protein